MEENFFENLKEKIKPYFSTGGSHALDHTQRVYTLAIQLSKDKKLDMDIVKASALLHDIARLKEDNKETECHAKEGVIMAEKILKEVKFPENKIRGVIHAIRVHRHSAGLKAETKEAEILQDADRLDALGAITVARMFSTGGELNLPLYDSTISFDDKRHNFNTSVLHGFYNKIFKITPQSFNTLEAKKIAKERYNFVKQFVERFLKEWKGEL
jgi:uncharacterized protein